MSRQPNVVLKRQARKMVYDVYCFMQKGGKNDKETVKQTAEATKVSESTVRRIIKEAKNSDLLTVFRTPGKKRNGKKRVTGIDSFDQSLIKRCVYNYHNTNNELPTVERLRKKLKEDIDFNCSERSLRRILNSLGFRWKRTENNRSLLIEKSNIRLLRIEYLQKVNKYREEGRPIIYTDESYVDSSHSSNKSWSDGSTKGLKKPISKGQRVVIVNAGSEAGFVPNALLLFKAGTKTGDYHDNMNFDNYEKWIRCQLLPNLPPNSVVVVDNASYHNKQSDPAPTANARKGEMKKWLQEKGIPYSEYMLKPQLHKIIKLHKEQHKTYTIDKILTEHGHTVLRLPPYHPDLNAIEMAWASVKGYVASKNVSWNINKVMDLVKEKVATMGASEWIKLCRKVQETEKEYIKSDHVVDLVTDEFVFFADDESDSDDDEYEDDVDCDDDDTSYMDEEPTPSTSSANDTLMEGVAVLPQD